LWLSYIYIYIYIYMYIYIYTYIAQRYLYVYIYINIYSTLSPWNNKLCPPFYMSGYITHICIYPTHTHIFAMDVIKKCTYLKIYLYIYTYIHIYIYIYIYIYRLIRLKLTCGKWRFTISAKLTFKGRGWLR
jgi:hypothetical protein